MLARSEAEAFRKQAQMLAMQIGVRPAARALGLKETRVQTWSKRYKWGIAAIRPVPSGPIANPASNRNATEPINALASILAVEGDRTRSAMARTARRAFEHADTLTDDALHDMQRAIALEKHGRNAQMAHGWNQQAVNVGVQVNALPLPSAEERSEMRSIDAKLDAIAAKLKA